MQLRLPFTCATIAVLFILPARAQLTTLTVTPGQATLDGVVGEFEYSNFIITLTGVGLHAVADGEFLYLAASWFDDTENVAKKEWSFDGSSWSVGSEDEDRLAFVWDMGQTAEGPTCTAFCHTPLMHTNGGRVDVWHWKAARTNAVGFIDDKYWDETDRQSDPGTKTYVDNDGGTVPTHMAKNDPGANVDFLAADAAALSAFDPFGTVAAHTVQEAVAFNPSGFSAGHTIPFYLLRPAEGDRASVQAAGKYENQTWTVEFKKPYAGSDFDFEVVPGSSIDFTHEKFDNTGSNHPDDGWDPRVYTLDFSMLTGVGVETELLPNSFALSENYPDPFHPTTTISYDLPVGSEVTLTVYDVLGRPVRLLDSGEKAPGTHFVTFDATGLSNGVYLYRLEADGHAATRSLVVLK